jgi:hypothetical protein
MMKYNIVKDHARRGKVFAYPANHWPRLNSFEKLGEVEDAKNAAEAKYKYETHGAAASQV